MKSLLVQSMSGVACPPAGCTNSGFGSKTSNSPDSSLVDNGGASVVVVVEVVGLGLGLGLGFLVPFEGF